MNFNWSLEGVRFPDERVGTDAALQGLAQHHAEYVRDICTLERNPHNLDEVRALLRGEDTRHAPSERQQVLNQSRALEAISGWVREGAAILNAQRILHLHTLVAEEEALTWGRLREGEVRISGTEHRPPPAADLPGLFGEGLEEIGSLENPIEQALVYFCFGALNQFFYDGNKRTSRLTMNALLMRSGYHYISIPPRREADFDRAMITFYDTRDASAAMRFVLACYPTAKAQQDT